MKLILPMLFVLLIAEVPTVIELCVLTYDPQTGDKLPLSKRFLCTVLFSFSQQQAIG